MKNKWKRSLALLMSVVMVFGSLSLNAFAVETNADDDSQTESAGVTWEKIDADEVDANLIQDNTAVEENETISGYADDETVRAIVVLTDEPAAAAVADDETIAESDAVEEQQQVLLETQEQMVETISSEILDGEEAEVVWNLTLLTNAISLYVPYGSLDEIQALDGVKSVYIDTEYEIMESTDNIVAQETTGVSSVKTDSGYTGSGTRIAVIDTGTDTDHQSFSAEGYEYALYLEAALQGISYEEYVDSLDLLDEEEIDSVLTQLNASSRYEGLTASDLYQTSKLPFNYNYIDNNLDVTHDNDDQGEHGSHVAGIATANEYIPGGEEDVAALDFNADGALDQSDAQYVMDYVTGIETELDENAADLNSDGMVSSYDVYLLLLQIGYYEATGTLYVSAQEAVAVTGVAPNAQLITMKVFGADGGAYASDYMAALEDAVLLNCDVVNMSLGSASGFSDAMYSLDDEEMTAILTGLKYTDVVLSVAAGNDGIWAENDEAYGLTYADESGTATVAAPSTYVNALSVASSDNVGMVGYSFEAEGVSVVYTQTTGYGNSDFTSLDTSDEGTGTEYEFVMLEEGLTGAEEDFADLDLEGKIVFVQRGTLSFATKANNAVAAGAAAVVVYNNTSGSISMDLTGYEYDAPVVSILQSEAEEIMENATLQSDGTYIGTMTVYSGVTVNWGEEDETPSLSSYSSWGTTGALTIKPEITAPGGSIFSVNGADTSGTAYETMSGTSMATPHVTGVSALLSQYVEETDLITTAREVTGNSSLTQRALIQSLMMSTSVPMIEEATGLEYSVRAQGSGVVNASDAVSAKSFLLMDDDTDGKVKAELGDGTDGWSFSFTINNLSDEAATYMISDSILTTDVEYTEDGVALASDQMTELGADVSYSTGNSVTVAAGSSVQVTVSISIPDDVAAAMEEAGFTNGFYVEGFIYLTSDDDVTHSIPLLGWYGDWTDPSMYDDVDYLDVVYSTPASNADDETADEAASVYEEKLDASHMYNPDYSYGFSYTSDYSAYYNYYANTLLISYAGDDYYYYYYNGNIYGQYAVGTYSDTAAIAYELRYGDLDYLEYRNAINSTSSAQYDLYSITPALIRNAADMMLVITDADTGEVYYENDFDTSVTSSYYYSGLACWLNTADSLYGAIEGDEDWNYTDADGNALPEGTTFTISLLAATEYSVNEDGTIDWDALGDGAEWSYSFTIDNTAPEVTDMALNEETDTLTISVTDDRYVAAVVLCDGGATTAVDYLYPDMTGEEGQTAELEIDLSAYRSEYGNKAVVAVCDYAGNESYYAVNLNGEGSDYGTFIGIEYDGYGGYNWVAFDADVNMNETVIFAGDIEIIAAEYVGGYIFAEDANGILYGMLYEDLLSDAFSIESNKLASLANLYQDFAYDYSTGTLHAITQNNDGTTSLYSLELTGDYTETLEATYTGEGLTLACDDNGNLYTLYLNSESDNGQMAVLASGTYEMTELGDTGVTMDYLQSMTWNHNDETLYWSRFDALTSFATISEVYEFSFTEDEDGNITGFDLEAVGTLSGEVSGMMAPLTSARANAEEHQNVTVFDAETVAKPSLNNHTMTLNIGSSSQLSYNMIPFYSNYLDVTWSSSDESVATVDENGVVTAVSVGTCTVTIASAEDPSLTDTCTVTVTSMEVEITGTLSEMGSGITNVGSSMFYTYTLENGESSITKDDSIAWDTAIYDGDASDYGTNIASVVLARGSLWACEWNNTGLIWKIDPDTGEILDSTYYEPVDGDVMYGMTYSETTDLFTMEMNYNLYVDLTMDSDMYNAMFDTLEYVYLDDSVYGMYQYTYHRLNLYSYLHSVGSWNTEEDGYSKINIAGITTLEGEDAQNLTQDYQGNAASGASYTPTTTIVLLDNVGRLWYIDEVMNMTLDDNGNYVNGSSTIASDFNGVLTVDYTDDDGNVTYSVFVIRSVEETPLTDMFLDGDLGITYHFSDLYATTTEDTGETVFVMSLYDYWGNATTNDLYLYAPGDEESDEVFVSLGDTGEYNVIATIAEASVSGIRNTEEDTEETEQFIRPESFVGYYGSDTADQ